ncbi:MAG: GNAT family N-acetyltransferase [Planctomycetota bacterium]|jgi:GNAT superfamily N-acetyltransferase
MSAIREYTSADLDACRELWRDLTQRHREIYENDSIGGADPGVRFDESLRTPGLAGPWVREGEAGIIGLTGLIVRGQEGEIKPVVVAPGHRSRGIGTELIRHVVAEARARGIRILSIRPVARNVDAMRCFHRAGFSVLGHVDMFMDLGADAPGPWKDGLTLHGLDLRY